MEETMVEDDFRVRLGLLVMQSTPFCNIDCKYCYLPDRSRKDRMSEAVIEATARHVASSGLVDRKLTVVWHAGEPTVLPVRYYEKAAEIFRTHLPDTIDVTHNIQTNATLLSEAWIPFLQRKDVSIGVSLDGPQALHDAKRVTRSGAGTFTKVMEGIQKLKDTGVNFHVISVVGAHSLPYADEIYQFFSELRPKSWGFNFEEQEGVNRISSIRNEHLAQITRFVQRVFELNNVNPKPIYIREQEAAKRRITSPHASANTRNLQVVPFGHLNIDVDGNISTFSPELLALKHLRYGDFLFGNVLEGDLHQVINNTKFKRVFAEICAGNALCAKECKFYSVCGGGAPSNKLSEHGTFAASRTLYCQIEIQIPIRVLAETVK